MEGDALIVTQLDKNITIRSMGWFKGMRCNVLSEDYESIEKIGVLIVSDTFEFFGFGTMRICIMLEDYPHAIPLDRITEHLIQQKMNL